MNIPLETILDYVSYLNPEFYLSDRNMWISGVKLMPENHKLDTGFLYLSAPVSVVLPPDHPPIVYIKPPNDTTEIHKDNCVILNTDMSLSAVFNELFGAINLVNSWVYEVELSLSRNEGVQMLLDISARVFGNPIAVMTSAFKTIAATWEYEPADIVFWELLSLGYLTNDSYRKLKERGYLEADIMNGETHLFEADDLNSSPVAITAINDETTTCYIALMLCANNPMTSGTKQIYNFFVEKLCTYLRPNINSGDYYKSQFDNFIIDIIQERIVNSRDILERSLVYPPMFQTGHFTVLISHESSTALYLEHAIQNLATLFPGMHIILLEKVILLFPTNHSSKEKNNSFFDILDNYLQINRAFAGVSDGFVGIDFFLDSYKQARDSLAIGRKLNVSGRSVDILSTSSDEKRIYHFSEYHVYMLLQNDHHELGVLERIKRHDIDNNTDYYRILYAFLSFDRQFTKTSTLLHMHRNNVIYHIGRICDIFELNLDDHSQRLRLLLLYKLDDLQTLKMI